MGDDEHRHRVAPQPDDAPECENAAEAKERIEMMARGNQLRRTSPEAEGIPSSAVLDFVRAVEKHAHPLDAVQGFMLLRHGNVAAEGWWAPYGPEMPHSMFSLSKSFASTGIGLAVAEGRLTVDDPVLGFFPAEAPANPSEHLKAMRVRHLLSMNTGHKEDTTRRVFRDRLPIAKLGPRAPRWDDASGHAFRGEDDNWVRTFLSLPVEQEPGTWFVYNTAATYMLSAIVTKLTGETLLDYLRPRLFEPLGIANPVWETDPRGINLGGTGLHITTEGIARFGQLYLQKGMWQGRRLVPEGWIAEATRAHSDNSNTQTNPDWTAGYGYQFWRCRHDCYRGDGAFGQFCIVMPAQDAVLAIIGGVRDMQAVLDKVWAHLLPAMGPEALPADASAAGELRDTLASLSLPLPEGQLSSLGGAQWSGKVYDLEGNGLKLDGVALAFGTNRATLTVRDERGEHPVQIGDGRWLKGSTDVRGQGHEPVAAAGAWTADDTYEVRLCFPEGEFCPVLRFHYASDGLRLEYDPNVSWDPPAVTTISGWAAGSTGSLESRSPFGMPVQGH
jgi:CubicO group peptidase (beta-lactamase class C family)